MRFLFVLFISFSLLACAKQKEDICLNPQLKQNKVGQVLPVALSYSMPSSWQRSNDTSSMKLEERVIDPISQAKLKVFYFEAMKNMNEANIERWTNQFQVQGRELISQRIIEVNEIPVLEFIMSGNYIDKLAPMDPESESIIRPDFTMRAYIVETQTGTWFFKAVAPTNVINIQDANFKTLVNSFKSSY